MGKCERVLQGPLRLVLGAMASATAPVNFLAVCRGRLNDGVLRKSVVIEKKRKDKAQIESEKLSPIARLVMVDNRTPLEDANAMNMQKKLQ
jgi:hypothetical protein